MNETNISKLINALRNIAEAYEVLASDACKQDDPRRVVFYIKEADAARNKARVIKNQEINS